MAKEPETAPAKPESANPDTAEVAERSRRPFWDLREEIENLFDEFYSGNALAPLRQRFRPGALVTAASMPKLDVIDKPDELRLVAELPGMEEKDIDIEVTDSTLTLSGEKKEDIEEGEKEGDYYLCERRFGSFKRSVRLPEGIDHDKIAATFRNGVLTVRLPKTAEAQQPSRKIEVRKEA